MSIDRMALLAIKSLQSTSGAGASVITKKMVMTLWPELQSFLWKRYGPVVMTKYVYPLAQRTAVPLAKKVGMPIARKYGIPLAQKTGRIIWRKTGQPLVRKIFPGFYSENNSMTAAEVQADSLVLAEAPEMMQTFEEPLQETFLPETSLPETPLQESPQSYHQTRLGRHMGMGMLSRRLRK